MRRLIAAALVALLIFGALALAVAQVDAAGRHGMSLVPFPPERGSAVPATLRDGTPVWVSRDREGAVSVLAVASPNGIAVVFCPGDLGGLFTDPGPAARFDQRGRTLGGPGPTGILRYRAKVTPDGVLAGDLAGAEPRWAVPDLGLGTSRDPSPWDCAEAEGAPGSGAVHHPLTEEAVGVAEAPSDGRWHAVEGFLEVAGGMARICETGPPCAGAHRAVVGFLADRYPLGRRLPQEGGSADGAFLVRSGRDGRFHDVVVVQRLLEPPSELDGHPWPYRTTFTSTEPHADPAEDWLELEGPPASLRRSERRWEFCFAEVRRAVDWHGRVVATDGRRCWPLGDHVDWTGVSWWEVAAPHGTVSLARAAEVIADGTPRWARGFVTEERLTGFQLEEYEPGHSGSARQALGE